MRIHKFVSRLAAASLFLFSLTVGLAAASKSAGKVDLNSASEKDLEALPGVGKATAAKIVANRPYGSVDELSKAGLSAKTIDKLRSHVTAGSAASSRAATKETKAEAKKSEKTSKAAEETKKSDKKTAASSSAASGTKVDINTASEKELEALPGVGSKTAEKIIAKRPYSSVEDLSRAGVSKKTMEKIGPLVTVSQRPSSRSSSTSASSAPVPPGAPSAAGRTESTPASESKSKSASQSSTKESSASTAPYQAPPAKGMVWVNLETKVYHREGDRWYGKTVKGKYMTEAEAQQAGYRLSKEKDEPK